MAGNVGQLSFHLEVVSDGPRRLDQLTGERFGKRKLVNVRCVVIIQRRFDVFNPKSLERLVGGNVRLQEEIRRWYANSYRRVILVLFELKKPLPACGSIDTDADRSDID